MNLTSLQAVYHFLTSKDVLVTVFAAFFSSFVMYAGTVIWHFRLPNLSNALFWKDFAKGLNLVIAEIDTPVDPQLRQRERISLVLLGEVFAITRLISFFHTRKTELEITSMAEEADFDKIKEMNILILGGPKYNKAAQMFLREIEGELFYQFKRMLQPRQEESELEMKMLVGRDSGYPNFTYDFHKEIQYATIILRRSPYMENKQVLLVAGLSHESSLAGVIWLLERPFSFWLRAKKHRKGFQAVIKCRVIGISKTSNIEEVFYKELP